MKDKTMTTSTNRLDVSLNKLALWDGNVRKTGIESGLDELAASIAAHGLLNPLLVRKAAKGRFAIVAGQRRYLAMRRLAEAGTMPKTAPVSCHLIDGDQDDAELSLAENVVRSAMHPADQFEAWRGLIDKGATVPEIAARFGVVESTVKKRLALARVSPKIFDLYRHDAMGLDALQAYTLTDDHALQETVWENLSEWERDNPRTIRAALTEDDVACNDRRVRFVGLEAYTAAGGTVRRDLFDADHEGYVQDVPLLNSLTRQKLDAVAAGVKAEGWHWVKTRTGFEPDDERTFERAQPIREILPDAVQAEADQLQGELETLCDSENDEALERVSEIEARLEEIDASALVWPDEIKARAGVVVYLMYDGSVGINHGLIREEYRAAARHDHDSGMSGGSGEMSSGSTAALPASLIEDLTAQKTAALRIELARAPATALALVVSTLAGSVFYRGDGGVLEARLTTRSLRPSIREHETCAAMLALNAEHERVKAMLPEDQDDLWEWCLNAEDPALLNVLAVAAAHGIDAVESKADANHCGTEQGAVLAEALGLDMARWYRPTASGYFSRISKAAILSDLETARQSPCAPSWLKLKKDELAALAEREAAACGWRPALVQ